MRRSVPNVRPYVRGGVTVSRGGDDGGGDGGTGGLRGHESGGGIGIGGRSGERGDAGSGASERTRTIGACDALGEAPASADGEPLCYRASTCVGCSASCFLLECASE